MRPLAVGVLVGAALLDPGAAAVRQGRLARAEAVYAAGRRAHPRDPLTAYHLGTVWLWQGRYFRARQELEAAARALPPGRPQRFAWFNAGNADLEPAWVRRADGIDPVAVRRAIAAYQRVLRADPRDSAAKWNLELALRLLAQSPPMGGAGGGGGGGGGALLPPRRAGPQPPLSAAAAAALVREAQRREEDALRRYRRAPLQPRPGVRDW